MRVADLLTAKIRRHTFIITLSSTNYQLWTTTTFARSSRKPRSIRPGRHGGLERRGIYARASRTLRQKARREIAMPRIVRSASAKADILAISEFIARDKPDAALRSLEKLDKTLAQ